MTITPKFRTSEMIGLKAFMNPTVQEMEHYLINGERVRFCVFLVTYVDGCMRARRGCVGTVGGSRQSIKQTATISSIHPPTNPTRN